MNSTAGIRDSKEQRVIGRGSLHCDERGGGVDAGERRIHGLILAEARVHRAA
jgi:hypothetical protein